MLDLSPLVEQDPSEDHRVAQAGRELRRSLVQSPLQSMVNPEFKPACSEGDLKTSKEGDRAKNLAEDKVNDNHCSLLIQRSNYFCHRKQSVGSTVSYPWQIYADCS